MTPTPTYDLLGVGVRIEISVASLQPRIASLLSGMQPARGAPDHLLRLTGEKGRHSARLSLFCDGALVRAGMDNFGAEAMLMWFLNQLALRTSRYLVVHAGCVATEGRAIPLPGRSGAGKSTLVAALVRGGFDYLSDEYAALDPETGLIHPYSLPLKLEPGARAGLALPGVGRGLESEEAPAYLLPDDVRPDCLSAPMTPAAIVFPRYQPTTRCHLEPLRRPEGLRRLAEQALNLNLLGGRGLRALARLVGAAPLYGLDFSDLEEARKTMRDIAAPPARLALSGAARAGR